MFLFFSISDDDLLFCKYATYKNNGAEEADFKC